MDRLANCTFRRPEIANRECLADNGSGIGQHGGSLSENGEELRMHPQNDGELSVVAQLDSQLATGVHADGVEYFVGRTQIDKVTAGNARRTRSASLGFRIQTDDAFRLRESKRLQQDSVHDAEDSGADAD